MKKILLILIIGIFIVGIISAVFIGNYEKVKDVDKINSKKICKELVKWEKLPENTNCNDYKDKNLEGSGLSIIEVDPDEIENNVYIVRYRE